MDALLALVADEFRTEESHAVLVGLQAAGRRSGWGRCVRPVFWPDAPAGAAGDLGAGATATDVVLVLHTNQRAAGEALLSVWESASPGRVLPVIVGGEAEAREWAARLERLANALPPVLIRPARDIVLGHGGLVRVTGAAQDLLEDRMRLGGHPAAWAVARNAPAVCPCVAAALPPA